MSTATITRTDSTERSGSHDTGVLLPYQRSWVQEDADVAWCAKSRQIGISWATAAWAVREAARHGHAGHSVYYLSYRHDVGKQFIDDVTAWADAYRAVVEREDEIIRDPDGDYQVYRVVFASGHEIVALPGRPRALRSRRGHVVIDEAAHLDDLPAVMEAAFAMIIWGHKIRIVSTHLGEGDFYQALQEAPSRGWAVHTIPFRQAVDDGMFRVVSRRTGREWTEQAEEAWEADVRQVYGERAAQELDCIPAETGAEAKVLPSKALYARIRKEAELPTDIRPQLGLDVSGDGRDRGSITVRYGHIITHVELLHGDTYSQAEIAHNLAMELNASVIAIDAGGPYGAAAAEWLRRTEYRTYEIRDILFGSPPAAPTIRFSAKTTQEQQFSRRNAQMAWGVRIRVVGDFADLIILESAPKNLSMPQYIQQMTQPVWHHDVAVRVVVDKGTPSPDAYDSTILAFSEDSRRGLKAPGYKGGGSSILML